MATIWKYVGKGDYAPGVPARDLTVEEHARFVKEGRIGPPKSASGKLYRKAKQKANEPEPTTSSGGDA